MRETLLYFPLIFILAGLLKDINGNVLRQYLIIQRLGVGEHKICSMSEENKFQYHNDHVLLGENRRANRSVAFSRRELIDQSIKKLNVSGGPFMDLTAKFGFRKVFCSPGGCPDLIDLLNSVLPKGEAIIETLYSFSPKDIGEADVNCLAVFDYYGKDQFNRLIAVEILDTPIVNFGTRNHFYACKAQQAFREAKRDTEYESIKVLSFQFLAFTPINLEPYLEQYPDPIIAYRNMNKSDRDHPVHNPMEEISIITIPLKGSDGVEVQPTRENEYLYLLNHLKDFESVPPYFAKGRFEVLFNRANIEKLSFGEAYKYLTALEKKKLRQLESNYLEVDTERNVREMIVQNTYESTMRRCRIEFATSLVTETDLDWEQIADWTGLTQSEVAGLVPGGL